MSTRATYQIGDYTFYIHHDGYPSGAAEYFARALEWRANKQVTRNPNATFADDFVHANPRAVLTSGHHHHPDTEYRYTVTTVGSAKLHLKAEGSNFTYHGTVQDFVNMYLGQEAEEDAWDDWDEHRD